MEYFRIERLPIPMGILTLKMSSYQYSPTAPRTFLTIFWVAVYIYQQLLWELKIEKSKN